MSSVKTEIVFKNFFLDNQVLDELLNKSLRFAHIDTKSRGQGIRDIDTILLRITAILPNVQLQFEIHSIKFM